MSGEIMERIASLTRPADSPEKWDFLPRVIGLRHFCSDLVDVVEALSREFTQQQLEAVRVLVPGDHGGLSPSPVLAAERLLFLRERKDRQPFDIVSQHGSLLSDDPPALACCRDFYTRVRRGPRCVAAAFSGDDLAVLRMMGIPCTFTSRLALLDGSQASRLFDESLRYGDTPPAAETASAVLRNDYRIILVACQLSSVFNKLPAGLNETVSRLLQVEEVFGYDTSERVGIWRPSESEFSRITSAIEFADKTQVSRVLRESIYQSSISVRAFAEQSDVTRGNDYCSARQELNLALEQARKRGLRSSEISGKLAALKQSFDATVIQAIISDALASANSVDRSLLLMAADLMGDWHESVELIRNAERGLEGRFQGRGDPLEPEELRDKLRVVDGLVKIHRELTRGK